MRSYLLFIFFALGSESLDVLPPRARGGKLGVAVPGWKEREKAAKASAAAEAVKMVPLDWSSPSSPSGKVGVRYWVDASCHRPGGPVFVHMGGEASQLPAVCGARERHHGAIAMNVEHRFYGRSNPVDVEAPLSLQYLKYLTTQQNLEDTAHLVEEVKAKYNASRAVAFGGSYSGATCAWFRQKYPTTVNGCVSSSGVVNTIFDFTRFDERVRKAVATPDASCPARLEAAMVAVDDAFAAGDGNKLKRQFNATNLIGTPQGDADFFYAVADAAAMLDQYGNKAMMCDHLALIPLNSSRETRLDNLNSMISDHYGNRFVSGEFYDSEALKKDEGRHSGSLGVGNRQWRWQKCSELAYLQAAPASHPVRPTGLTIEALVAQCTYVFGLSASDIHTAASRFNSLYWQQLPSEASNIVFLDFSDDPWQEASVNTSLSPTLPYCMTTCDGCGHCGAGAGVHAEHCNGVANSFIEKWLQ